MSTRVKASTVTGLLAFVLLAFVNYGHAAPPRTLIKNNPFLPPGFNAKKPTTSRKLPTKKVTHRTLELRSIIKFDDVWSFSIYDKKTQKSKLVELNDKEAEYHVIDFNEKTFEITLKSDTGPIKLKQFEGTGNPLAIAASESNIKRSTPQRTTTSPSTRRRRVITPNKKPQKKVYDMTTDELAKLFPAGHKKSTEELQKIIDSAKKANLRQQNSINQ